ncbi:Holliday junction resolvase [Fervidicella metallireducens AeB]|uniref:Putative pre-16S rRNA nuclease n=1 Tax=Fervidicella metallireducens AeB TaxID=1403537 RepID=A0A017RYL7_9CLOT|nr:Holliday junction resolvase RuvX [Fervidicella metallireducens]EYE89666.1 Holliday junction resolvase [Fervidicella metallireducens AeB]
MRVLGLDIGEKTIGVAVSDPMGWTAQGIKTIRRTGIKNDIKEIIDIVKEYNVEKIVAGLPKNMNGTLGPMSEKIMNFCEKLKNKSGLEIIYQDERLTTVAAERMLIGADVSRKKRKEVIDTVAATYILQGYLDRIGK